MKMPRREKKRWWILVLGVSAAAGIGFLAQDIAAWISDLLFSWYWTRSPRLASAEDAYNAS